MARVVLLTPSSTYRADDFLAAARALGVDVVVACDAPAFPNGAAVPIDLHDPVAAADTVVALDRLRPVDAVVAVDDAGVLAAATASERLGLPHAAPEAVARAQDKLLTRRHLAAAEVPQPAFRAVVPTDADDIVTAGRAVGFPCVVKPIGLSTSRGVIRADDPDGLVAAARRSARIAAAAGAPPGQPLLVEAFVAGPEVAVEAVVRAGRLHVLALFDKPDPLDGPYFEETIYVTPSRLPRDRQAAVVASVDAACRALGLRHGPVHAEVRVGGGRPAVLEVAPRTIGGLCGRTVALATGQPLEVVVLASALGIDVPDGRRHRAAGVLMVPVPAAGRLLRVDGVERARAVPGVTSVQITAPVGAVVAPAPDGDRYVGFVFAAGLTAGAAEKALRRAGACLTVQVDAGTPGNGSGRPPAPLP